jgi:hypothetical protein
MTAVCVADGPSLTFVDLAQVRHARHDGRVSCVIVVNNAYQLAPWADVLYAADARWWGWHEGAATFPGRKIGLQSTIRSRWPAVEVWTFRGRRGLETQIPRGLRHGGHSGYQALNLAVQLGGRRVLLLGYDCGIAEDGRARASAGHPVQQRQPYDTWAAAYLTMVAPLAAAGVAVLNCSRRTTITAFPVVPLEEALTTCPLPAH